MNYEHKYRKYKQKYLALKQSLALIGGDPCSSFVKRKGCIKKPKCSWDYTNSKCKPHPCTHYNKRMCNVHRNECAWRKNKHTGIPLCIGRIPGPITKTPSHKKKKTKAKQRILKKILKKTESSGNILADLLAKKLGK